MSPDGDHLHSSEHGKNVNLFICMSKLRELFLKTGSDTLINVFSNCSLKRLTRMIEHYS